MPGSAIRSIVNLQFDLEDGEISKTRILQLDQAILRPYFDFRYFILDTTLAENEYSEPRGRSLEAILNFFVNVQKSVSHRNSLSRIKVITEGYFTDVNVAKTQSYVRLVVSLVTAMVGSRAVLDRVASDDRQEWLWIIRNDYDALLAKLRSSNVRLWQ